MESTCTKCKVTKPTEEFNNSKSRKSGIRAWCKVCERSEATKYSKQNPEPYRKRAAIQRDLIRAYLHQFAYDLKTSKGCSFCDEDAYCVLDFHHLEDGTSVMGTASKGYARFIKELHKCIIVCANCHRKIHGGFLHPTDDMRLRDIKIPTLAELKHQI